MTLETERRKENRKRPPSLVYVELASANGGMMRDICEEGFAVRAMIPLRVGDSTSFAFSVDASTRFEGACQVQWVAEEGRVAGLKFTEVSPQFLEQMRAWLSGETPPLAKVSAAPFVPEQEVNSLQELRDELRTVRPRVEILGGEIPAVEDPGTKIPQLEIPQVEVHPLEIAREEAPLMEDAHGETPSAELPPVELPPVEIAREEAPLMEDVHGETPSAELPPVELSPVEIARKEAPLMEDAHGETPSAELPPVELPPVEIARKEAPLMEDAQGETPSAELPPVELPPVYIPPEGPSRQLHDAEISRMEGVGVPHVPLGLSELLQEQVEQDEPLQFPTSAKRTPAPLTDLPLGPTALEPLPEWGGGPESFETPASIAHLDPTTVSLAIRILIFLALVATVVVYHRQLGDGLIWLGARLSGAQTVPAARSTANAAVAQTLPATPVPSPAGADPAQHPSPAAEQKEAVPSSSSTSQTNKPGEVPAATGNPLPALKPPIPVVPAPSPTTNKSPGQKLMPESNSEAGQQEYTQAQEILKSKDREAGLSEAVRLLWIAVEKGNSAAEVSLAELYRRGEGVSRNCDQTQILLTAAARKGNGEAQKRLERFLKEGCE